MSREELREHRSGPTFPFSLVEGCPLRKTSPSTTPSPLFPSLHWLRIQPDHQCDSVTVLCEMCSRCSLSERGLLLLLLAIYGRRAVLATPSTIGVDSPTHLNPSTGRCFHSSNQSKESSLLAHFSAVYFHSTQHNSSSYPAIQPQLPPSHIHTLTPL